MISSLIAALRRIQLEPTAEEVADAIWLAVHMGRPLAIQERESEGIGGLPPGKNEADSELPRQPPPLDGLVEASESVPSDTASTVYTNPLPGSGLLRRGVGVPFRVPAALALPGALGLARALRPLMRRVPSRTTSVFDEGETVRRIAEEGIWMPILQPAAEHWLEVALVVDVNASMVIWNQTIAEMQRLLERQGAFRDIRRWNLVTYIEEVKKETLSYAGAYLADASGRVRAPHELVDPAGRRLILIITDCVSSAWYNGAVAQMLAIWGRANPVAIIQVLPQQLWQRTALGAARIVRVRTPMPGVPNTLLRVEPLRRWSSKKSLSGTPIPIMTLEPMPLGVWARLVSGGGGALAQAFIFTAVDTIRHEKEEQQAASVTPQERVQRFQATASSLALELAGLLAAAPLRLPVMRLVQQTMLPQSRQVHLAEVFLSGLLKHVSYDKATHDSDTIQYDFIEGVRDLLLDNTSVPDAVQVLKEVSRAIEGRYGQTLDFQAILTDPTATDGIEIDDTSRPFATVASKVLRRLGGRYTQVAEHLDRNKDGGYITEVSDNLSSTPIETKTTSVTGVRERYDSPIPEEEKQLQSEALITCLVTLHSVVFEQPPTQRIDAPAYADPLHMHLSNILGPMLSDDPKRSRIRSHSNGVIYVQSLWGSGDGIASREEGLKRLGYWAEDGRSIRTENAPLIANDGHVSHIALVYSNLEPNFGKDSKFLVPSRKGLFSGSNYANVAEQIQRALTDIMARFGGDSASGRQATGPGSNEMLRALEEDVARYVSHNEERERVRSFLSETLSRLAARDDVGAIILNTHSNGTVIAFDVLPKLPPFAIRKIKAFITAGSPLRKYVELFYWGRQIECPVPIPPWYNFWDQRDPVADPLVPSVNWHRGTEIDPSDFGLFNWVNPNTGMIKVIQLRDILVDNIKNSLGGRLRAHNYWDNQKEFVMRLATIVKESLL